MKKIAFNGVLLLILLLGCKHYIEYNFPPQPIVSEYCSADSVYFENDVLPILLSSCTMSGCHNANSAADGVVLIDYQNVMNTVVAGNPNASELYQQIVTNQMPPSPHSPLPQEQKDIIKLWIQQGALYNKCLKDTICDTTNISFSKNIQPILNKNCVGCHSSTNANGNPPVVLDNYNSVITEVNNGRLLGSIMGMQGFVKMPPTGNLSQCEINQIKIWINNGAPNN